MSMIWDHYEGHIEKMSGKDAKNPSDEIHTKEKDNLGINKTELENWKYNKWREGEGDRERTERKIEMPITSALLKSLIASEIKGLDIKEW